MLAIASMMMVGILATASNSISRQRYKDASDSLVSYFQDQYSMAVNVRNNRPSTQSCNTSGMTATSDAGKGTSDCMIIGRLLQSSDGMKITSRPVYGTADAVGLSATGDKDALIAAGLVSDTDPAAATTYELAWSTGLSAKGTNRAALPFSMAILRSPTSGTVHTFVLTGSGKATMTPNELVNDLSSTTTDTIFCVAPKGMQAGEITGVKIMKDAASAAGVLFANGADCA